MRKVGKMHNEKLREFQLKTLAGILSHTKNAEEAEAVLHTILTPSEKAAISQRTAIILELEKECKYFDIEGRFGVSSSTISKTMDIYLKNAQHNEVFHRVLDRFDAPEYKPELPTSKYDLLQTPLASVGVRQLLRENEKQQKRVQKLKQTQ